MIRTAFIAAAIKDGQLLLRDRGALASLFALPIVFIAVFGLMFQGPGEGGERDPAALPIHYEQGDERGEAIASAVEAMGMFRPERLADPDRVRARVGAGDAIAGLIVPPDFEPMAGVPAELVIDEARSPDVVGPIRGGLTAAIARAVFGGFGDVELLEARPPSGAEPAVGPTGFQVAVPGNAVLFGFFLALTLALSMVEERQSGTWRRLLATPLPRRVVLVAKLAPYLLIGLVQMALFFGVGALAFGMEVAGSVLALAALTAAVVFCALALGLFLASFGGTSKQIGGVGSIALLVMGLLGGAMFPRPLMPEAMKTIGLATPHAWALEGYYDVIIRAETGVGDIAPAIAAVAGFGIAFAALGALRFRFER